MFDDLFETLRPSTGNRLPESNWQAATGLAPTKTLVDKQKASGETNIHASEEVQWVDMNKTTTYNQEGVGEDAPDDDTSLHAMPPETTGDVPEQGTDPPPVTTRSGRASIPTERMRDSRIQQKAGLVALHVSWEVYHDGGYQIEDELDDPIACAASSNPDIMYIDEAMRAPDRDKFEEAMMQEVQAHTENEHWVVRKRTDVPEGTKVLPAVWATRRKRRISTGEAYKWKARLNVHGGKQEHGVNYWETYAPVIGWTTIRLFLIFRDAQWLGVEAG